MKKIAFVVPHFGQFKNYFPAFIESCRKNSTVDWLVFTDNSVENVPENVHVFKISFEQLRNKIQQCFDFEICLNAPYKLCDYKPAYGHIFEEFLTDYDFWGYCDSDLIFGNIRYFITDSVLEQHERIFSRGHCQLFHNTDRNRFFYRNQKIVDYKAVYTTQRNCSFDEWAGISIAWKSWIMILIMI